MAEVAHGEIALSCIVLRRVDRRRAHFVVMGGKLRSPTRLSKSRGAENVANRRAPAYRDRRALRPVVRHLAVINPPWRARLRGGPFPPTGATARSGASPLRPASVAGRPESPQAPEANVGVRKSDVRVSRTAAMLTAPNPGSTRRRPS